MSEDKDAPKGKKIPKEKTAEPTKPQDAPKKPDDNGSPWDGPYAPRNLGPCPNCS